MYAFVDPELMLDLVRLRMEELRATAHSGRIATEPNGEKLQRRDQKSAAWGARSSIAARGRGALLRLRAWP